MSDPVTLIKGYLPRGIYIIRNVKTNSDTLPSQKYGNPLKNPIYYNGKVPLVKCLKSHHCWWKNTTERLINISLVLNFPHRETYLPRASELRESAVYWSLHPLESKSQSKYIRDTIWGVKVERSFRWSIFNTTLIPTSLFVIFFHQHHDFLNILLMGLCHYNIWDFSKGFHIFVRGVYQNSS